MDLEVGGKTVVVERARLRKWFALEELREQVRSAAERGETDAVSEAIGSYLSAASSEDSELFLTAPWMDAIVSFNEIERLNALKIRFPILDDTVSSEEDKPVSWDYEGRNWYTWAHLLASHYGWTLEQIENLEIEDGVALVQEIEASDQLRREFEWSCSEIAYPFNPATKKGEFKPLPRPQWMKQKAVFRTTKLLKSMLPVGEIVNLSGVGLHGQLEDVVH